MSNAKKFQEVLDLLEQKKQKKTTDTLKASRVGEEEKYKASQPYREAQEKNRKAKELKAETDLKAEKEKAKPESGTEAVDRLLKEYKTARGLVVDKSGTALYPKDFPGKDSAMIEQFGDSGYPGTVSAMGIKRVDELKKELEIAQKAKDENRPIKDVKVGSEYSDKLKEYAKLLGLPMRYPSEGAEGPPEDLGAKTRYLMQLQAKDWLKKNYPNYIAK